MTAAGLGVKKYYLDNEASEDYKAAIRKNESEVERVAPGNHTCHITERAVQIAKDPSVSNQVPTFPFRCTYGAAYWSMPSSN